MTIIGASVPRHDALDKVTGAAAYPADLVRPGMLHLKAVFAGRPHARIVGIDASRALAYPGVVAVFTASDVPYNFYGLVVDDQEVLCSDVVRYVGDRVALVAARNAQAAAEGAALVAVAYEDLPAVCDARAALAPDAPLVHLSHGSNVLGHVRIRKGDVAAAFAACDVAISGEFETSWQEHAYLQPDAGIAYPEGDGIVIETAGQWLHEDRRQLAKILGLPEERVTVRYAKIGGAFGGREDLSLQPLLALAAHKLGKPVAMVWSREESVIGHTKRHPYFIRTRWGARRDGKILAVEAELVADGGAYASTSVEVLKGATLFSTGVYEVDNIAADGYVAYTNNVPCGAFRGFGAPQAQFAVEIMIARLASTLDLDPAEMRRRNIYREGSIQPTGEPLPRGVGAAQVLERCVEEARTRFGYGMRKRQPESHVRRGVGLACGFKNVGYSFGFDEQATATVEIEGDGRIERALVRVGAADVGQGAHLVLRQIVAEALGVSLKAVRLVSDDSNEAPNAGSASASRMTLMGGRAVHDAAKQALAHWKGSEAVATVAYRPPRTTPLDKETLRGRPTYSYGYAAQAVELEVNVLTGQVQVLRIISVHDVGRAINKQQVEAQIEGCLAQAVGYVLTEHFQCSDGRMLTPHFSTYLLPTTLDMPTEVIPILLETPDPNGPFGARGVAEMPLIPFAGAVASAIYDAVGAWVTQLPMTPERVIAAIEQTAI